MVNFAARYTLLIMESEARVSMEDWWEQIWGLEAVKNISSGGKWEVGGEWGGRQRKSTIKKNTTGFV